MSDYTYTYPRDLSYLDALPDRLRRLARHLSDEADATGADLADLVRERGGPPEDKAALAEVFAGPQAAAEFRR
jgi:hypothetical protein